MPPRRVHPDQRRVDLSRHSQHPASAFSPAHRPLGHPGPLISYIATDGDLSPRHPSPQALHFVQLHLHVMTKVRDTRERLARAGGLGMKLF